MRLQVQRDIAASPALVWKVLTEWERQPEWMLDAIDVEVLTAERSGEGVTIRCPTRLLGLRVNDVMRVTRWEPERLLAVEHLGRIITGTAAFELSGWSAVTSSNDGRSDMTRVVWWEEIDPPLGALGEWGASTLVLPWLRRLFSRSLDNFGRLVEAEAG